MTHSPYRTAFPNHESLYIVNFGEEKCQPLHAYGPAQRKYYLIHFVVSGHGTLYHQKHSYPVAAGQGFLILPGEETYYQADASAPWHYAWVGYSGAIADDITHAAGLSAARRVFTAPDPHAAWQTLSVMRSEARDLRLSQLAAAGNLLRFLAQIAPLQEPGAPSPKHEYCEKAVWFLEGHFNRSVSIQETADFVGLSRSHLYRLMLEEYGCSPKEMLLRIRMRHAESMLRSTTLTLDEIAHSIGLQTGAQLGVVFRTTHGITPGQYRQNASNRNPEGDFYASKRY